MEKLLLERARARGEMFSTISPRYDLLNGIISLGRMNSWRRQAVALAGVPSAGLALDVATGTGEMALEMARRGARVVGIDLSPAMLQQGRAKAQGKGISIALGDALALPFKGDTFDSVAIAFASRNVVDLPASFAELRRVVKPGGRVVCLEAIPASSPLFRAVQRCYFSFLVPWIGGLLTGRGEAYRYLGCSIFAFPPAEELKEIAEGAGLGEVEYHFLHMGMVIVLTAVKNGRKEEVLQR